MRLFASMKQRTMLCAKLFRSLIASSTRRQVEVSRPQNIRQSCRKISRGVAVKEADKDKRERRHNVAAKDCRTLPFAFTREYWLHRREDLLARLDRLYIETGDPDLIDAVAASQRYAKKMWSGQIRQGCRQWQVLCEKIDARSGPLAQAAHDGVVPGATAIMELITQCNKILIYEGNGYDKSPYVEPAHEVNHSAIAALLAQSAQSQRTAINAVTATQCCEQGFKGTVQRRKV